MPRHRAPGTGDPAGFRPGDCGTQRNLSVSGQREARVIGAGLRAAGVAPALVATSRWCRCRDTARLPDLGPVQDWPVLDSFLAERGEGPARATATLARLAALPVTATVLPVTHQVNITALTGIVPRSGGIASTRRRGGGLAVADRLRRP